MEPLFNYFFVSLLLFAVEIIINAATLNFVAFSRYLPAPSASGQVFVVFAIALAAAEAAAGLAIILVAFRLNKDVDIRELRRLRG